MWAQHGHIQCARNTHLLGELGHAPSMKVFFFEILHSEITLRRFLATYTTLSVLPVCSLNIHMKAITHANNWSLTLAFYIIFTWAPVNFMLAHTQVCPGVANTLMMFASTTRYRCD